jgi:hypothetical protein
MSVTLSQPYTWGEFSIPPFKGEVWKVLLADDSPAGGYPITAAQVGLSHIIGAAVICIPGGSGYVFEWDCTNNKLMVWEPSGATSSPMVEVPDRTNLADISVVLLFIGL